MLPTQLPLPREVIRAYLSRIAWRRQTKLEQRGNFDEKYPEDPLTAFLVSGRQFFSREILIARKRELFHVKPWAVLGGGMAKIWHQKIPGRRYLIGADVLGGPLTNPEDQDWNAAVVGDIETGAEVASYRSQQTPHDLAYDLAELGEYYNNAVIAVERNNQGGATLLTLAGECGYGAIYKHRDWWKRNKQKVIQEFEGFPTTGKSRPVALSYLNQFVLDTPELIMDEDFINEALVFVLNEKGIPSAAKGAHDDTVSARWVFHFVRRVLMGWLDPTDYKRVRYLTHERLMSEEAVDTEAA